MTDFSTLLMAASPRKKFKIVVAGPFSAGKSQFIATASSLRSFRTETKISDETSFEKQHTTVAMDFGRVDYDGKSLYLFGTPGQERFEFMWKILTVGMHALLIIVDATDLAGARDAVAIADYYQERHNIPIIVCANKQDFSYARTPEQMCAALDLPRTIPLLPLIARDPRSVRLVCNRILKETENWLY